MTDDMRKQLDALMGSDRNSSVQKRFTDGDVCKYYLCGLCPHEIFSGTKMNLGECPKKHSETLREQYEEARKTKDYGFEYDLERELERLIADCDRKIIKARKRLEDPTDYSLYGSNSTNSQMEDKAAEEIKDLYVKAELLGSEGKVDESLRLISRAEQLKQEQKLKSELKSAPPPPFEGLLPGSNPTQKLRVCEICAAFLSIYDSDTRLKDHYNGKLHIGYNLVRDKLREIKVIIARNEAEKPVIKRRSRSRERRSRSRSRDRKRRRSRSRDKYRRRSRSRSRDRRRGRNDRSDIR